MERSKSLKGGTRVKTIPTLLLLLATAFAQDRDRSAGNFDGPAELPRVTLDTSIAATPSPNPPRAVLSTASLQGQLKTAVCGDTFKVDPRNVTQGSLVLALPTLHCPDDKWITITSAGQLPDEGERVDPSYADQMPKIILKSGQLVSGCDHVRLIGFEITRLKGTGTIYNFITPGAGNTHCVIDRSYVHGTPTDETVRGMDFRGASHVGVVDSYFADFHCRAPGSCSDSQALLMGVGDGAVSVGDYVIKNNYLEASAENVMIGGGGNASVPCDITIQGNDIVKPMYWNQLDPNYDPANRWSVKNLFEMKTGCRVLVEGNRLANTWGGFSQIGFAVLLGAKNQSGNCAVCAVTDVTFRYNWIANVGQAFQLFSAPSGTAWSAGNHNWSIHDVLVDNAQYASCYQCGRWLIQLSSGWSADGAADAAVLHDVVVDHIQVNLAPTGWLSTGGFLLLGAPPTNAAVAMTNIKVTNSVFTAGTLPMYSTGGGTTNCFTPTLLADYGKAIATCWKGDSAFTANVILSNGSPNKAPYPEGNYKVVAGVNPEELDDAISLRKLAPERKHHHRRTHGHNSQKGD